MKTIHFKVEGMVCTGCENRLQNALKNLEEIQHVVADHERGTVTITLKDELPIHLVEEKLQDLGFEIIKEEEK